MSESLVMQPDRNLALELARATESAALAAARWMGRGSKESADQAAVDALRTTLHRIEMDGIVVIGEGEKDEAPMLFIGENVGSGSEPRVDIAVDPIDGTRLLSNGMPNALAVVALSERGTMHYPPQIAYMEKIATGPEAAHVIDIEVSVTENLRRVAEAKQMAVRDLTVVILDRPRHASIIDEVRAAGARIKLIMDGDVAGAIMAALPGTGVDLLVGIGGASEGTISVCALKCIGGNMQCRIWPRNEDEWRIVREQNLDTTKVFGMDDLVSSDNVFFSATGITDGELLQGVHYTGRGATTESLVMRSRSGTIRRIAASHRLDKLEQISVTEY
ncbi:MAG TPA: class II fructose-bisphosphatase [Thermomicrobiales bacterium]|jgi:fructose-1,6-bisphosphatase II|nr:class II fructose-bisphosphatase [Thermomicrobiales bacterium]HRA32029.1 class II fructose-bisphosphatase [Thermomicrobiales bacterium]